MMSKICMRVLLCVISFFQVRAYFSENRETALEDLSGIVEEAKASSIALDEIL